MKKGLLWGCGGIFSDYIHLIKLYEILNKFKIIGVTSKNIIYSEIMGYECIDKKDVMNKEFDFVIIMVKDNVYNEIFNEALELGIARECIFSYRVLKHYNFDLNKYMELKKNPPSIFSNNCWGGNTYHSLNMEFMSPLINMYENDMDYLKLLQAPKRYFEEKLELVEMGYNKESKIDFPIVKCGDIVLNFNHYSSFEMAVECWERRKKRIDWNNIFVMMYTENKEIAKEFVKLPYQKKVCFVPFETEEPGLVYVDLVKGMPEIPFYQIVNGMANGRYPYYDVIDLLKETKITKVVAMRDFVDGVCV